MTQTQLQQPRKGGAKRIVCIALFALAAIMLIVSVTGFVYRGTESTVRRLDEMRISAVLHAASGGIVDSIASQASAAKLKELRARSDFRSLGMDEVKELCAEAEGAARAEAEALYSNTDSADSASLDANLNVLETAMADYVALETAEKSVYEDIYKDIFGSVADWTDFVGDKDDGALLASLQERAPALGEAANAHLQPAMLRLARSMSDAERVSEDEELYGQLFGSLCGVVPDWTAFDGATDDELWSGLSGLMPDLAEGERFKDRLLGDARGQVTAALNGEALYTAREEAEAVAEAELVADYTYFEESEALSQKGAQVDAAYETLWAELVTIIPDLSGLDRKMQSSIRDTIEDIAYSGSRDFTTRYNIYAAQKANNILKGNDGFLMRLSAMAGQLLIACAALLLVALACLFWKPLVSRLGVPRTIISLFFVFLCLAAELYNISVPMMLGNVLERVGMYGVLVLAMLPGIQCGIGLNMGMTIGCISGLLATIIALQYNMTGYEALTFSCVVGVVIAAPLGWAYSKLLNRMKGNEMTISTYVGFSFVSLMCIGWMLLPFNNPKIIWLLCGRGLRVTHGLLDSFAHILDNLLAFELFGTKVPTGLLLFFLLCCGVMWLFSRSKTGIAMSAAGSNPRFAEASGINVNSMRTIGTVLSTMIAAVGIVIYSQAFGYAQLYTAPRQLGFIAASAILIGGATVSKAKVGHVVIGVFLFEGVLALGQQIANAAVAGGGLSEVMRIMISNGIILYALTQSGGASRE